MKKIFTIILSFLYLVSGIGFGSMHHHCQNMQQMISPCESQCCSTESTTGAHIALHQAEKLDTKSCCDMTATALSTSGCGSTYPGDCCQIQHKYNQPDSPPLSLKTYVIQDAKPIGEFNHYPQLAQNMGGYVLTNGTDPSAHVNLPLLI
jgi:hypothetical protein